MKVMATDLQNNLAAIYSIPFEDSRLLRDMIGHVSSLSCGSSRYVFKLFRSDYSGQAVQSVEIMTYLHEAGVYAPRIIPTAEGERYCCLDTEKGRRIGVLYEYVDGAEPAKQRCMEDIGRVA
jgi:Ser/Thr protein kinase RdoA (MazF antagonist)